MFSEYAEVLMHHRSRYAVPVFEAKASRRKVISRPKIVRFKARVKAIFGPHAPD